MVRRGSPETGEHHRPVRGAQLPRWAEKGRRRGWLARSGDFTLLLGGVDSDGHREYDAGEIAQRAYDNLGVMLLDPCLYKVVVGGEHEK